MRTEAELREELAWLINYKKEVVLHFKVIELSKRKHALLAAFYATLDHEADLLRWVLGEDLVLWRDDFSAHNDIQAFFDSLPPSEFPRNPWPHEIAAARKAKTGGLPALFPCLHCGKTVCIASHNICASCLTRVFSDELVEKSVDEAAN
jgi:hypothetical protein